MLKLRFTYFFLFIVVAVWAQKNEYTYVMDKKFKSPQDLIGYRFVPNELEIPNEDKYELGPDEYAFGISQNNLYVHGEDIKGVYNVNNINTTEYGFKLTLMNARDPRQQGHLKVILVGKKYVDALVFKRSNDDKELIFFLPQMSDEMDASEKAFYTDKMELELLETDSLWGTKVVPFFRVYQQGSVHEKLLASDSTWVEFIEEIKTVEKTKAIKSQKGKKAKKELLEADSIVQEVVLADSIALQEGTDSLQTEVVKTKTIKTYYLDLHTFGKNKSDELERMHQRYVIKKIKEREDELAGANQERFQLELETNKGILYIYLTGRRTISSIEIGGERYLMRGH